jgi:hypothetical protein
MDFFYLHEMKIVNSTMGTIRGKSQLLIVVVFFNALKLFISSYWNKNLNLEQNLNGERIKVWNLFPIQILFQKQIFYFFFMKKTVQNYLLKIKKVFFSSENR